jgi:hypothetical protein
LRAWVIFGNAVERAVEEHWKTADVVSKLEKGEELFVAQMERRH